MGAIVKVTNASRLNTYLRVHEEFMSLYRSTEDNLGWYMPASRVEILSTEGNRPLEGDVVKRNQVIRVWPLGEPIPNKYTAMVGFNPKLTDFGIVNCSPFVPPGNKISMTIKALRDFNIEELKEAFITYIID